MKIRGATCRTAIAWVGVAIAGIAAGPTSAPTTSPAPVAASAPATSPATTRVTRGPATSQAAVDPAAQALLDRLQKAYTAAGPLHVVGDVVGDFDVAGRRKRYTLHVDGRTDGDGHFRHDVGATGLIVNDGKTAYLYDGKRDAFATLDAFDGRQPAGDIDQALIDVLLDENPALLLSLTTDPDALLRRSAKAIRPATQPCALVLEVTDKTITLRLRPDDGTIARSEVDFRPLMKSRHAQAVVAADATLRYESPDPRARRPVSVQLAAAGNRDGVRGASGADARRRRHAAFNDPAGPSITPADDPRSGSSTQRHNSEVEVLQKPALSNFARKYRTGAGSTQARGGKD